MDDDISAKWQKGVDSQEGGFAIKKTRPPNLLKSLKTL